ncbi:MAG: hypothetical protein R6V04_03400 [bacterium]
MVKIIIFNGRTNGYIINYGIIQFPGQRNPIIISGKISLQQFGKGSKSDFVKISRTDLVYLVG